MAARKYEIDKIAVNEAILLIDNDAKMYDVLMKTYLPNLQKKLNAGKYDKEKAVKLLEYFYTNYARPRLKSREYGWDPKLNPAERQMFAKYFSDYLYDEFLKPMIKNKPKKQKTLSEQLKIKFPGTKQKGWHKDHYNYNKAEKWEVEPKKRKVPARNVKKANVLSQPAKTKKKPTLYKGFTINYINGEYRATAYGNPSFYNTNLIKLKGDINKYLK